VAPVSLTVLPRNLEAQSIVRALSDDLVNPPPGDFVAAPAPALSPRKAPTLESALAFRDQVRRNELPLQSALLEKLAASGPPPATQDDGPFGARAHLAAQQALDETRAPAADHPYAAQAGEDQRLLGMLGLNGRGTARIHIDDDDPVHGPAVVRNAVGPTTLAQGADVTLGSGADPEIVKRTLTPEQLARVEALPGRIDLAKEGRLSATDTIDARFDQLEASVLDKRADVADIRAHLPADANEKTPTLVNFSWGESPLDIADRAVNDMLRAPKGSPLATETEQILGHGPRLTGDGERARPDRQDIIALHGFVDPKVRELLRDPEKRARLDRARAGLEGDLAAGRKQGLLAFQAAGNDYEMATILGAKDLSGGITTGVAGLIHVGAVDTTGPGGAGNPKMWEGSARRGITVAAAGVDLPVGDPTPGAMAPPRMPINESGTSGAAPNAIQVAYRMHASNPKLGVNELEGLLTDPRALNRIADDPQVSGAIDPFAAVVLAANPSLDREQIEAARRRLRADPSSAGVAAVKRDLGLR
jgi:hypothetical protein